MSSLVNISKKSINSTTSGSLSVQSSQQGKLRGREVIYDRCINNFHKGLVWEIAEKTRLSADVAILVTQYYVDPCKLEPALCPDGALVKECMSEKGIMLQEVFLKNMVFRFSKENEYLEERLMLGMSEFREVDLRAVLNCFKATSDYENDGVEKVHKLVGDYVTKYAPKLEKLTLRKDFLLQIEDKKRANTMNFSEELLRKYLPQHKEITIILADCLPQRYIEQNIAQKRVDADMLFGNYLT